MAASTAGSDLDWDGLLAAALRGHGVSIACQPIVEAGSGRVAGYEALARFTGPPGTTPDQWFTAARRRGLSADLDAVVISSALGLRATLPANCFLAVNVEPDSLGHDRVHQALVSTGRLDGVVLEVTEHKRIDSYAAFEERLDCYRNAGALVALDDAGAGYSGLQQILRLRPAILKLDRALVEGIDLDEAKWALVEMLGVFASRIDAWILAEGVERPEEAATLRALGVPLAQGYFYALPAAPWAGLGAEAARLFARMATTDPSPTSLASLVVAAPWISESELPGAGALLAGDIADHLVVVDQDRRAVGIVDRDGALVGEVRRPLKVNVHSSVVETAERMLTRPAGERLDPVVCHDDLGCYLGTLAAERVLRALTTLAAATVTAPAVTR
jgi:EAL domain-containing protein (putative c-di-GMP-specific phosphodiesterase class I)